MHILKEHIQNIETVSKIPEASFRLSIDNNTIAISKVCFNLIWLLLYITFFISLAFIFMVKTSTLMHVYVISVSSILFLGSLYSIYLSKTSNNIIINLFNKEISIYNKHIVGKYIYKPKVIPFKSVNSVYFKQTKVHSRSGPIFYNTLIIESDNNKSIKFFDLPVSDKIDADVFLESFKAIIKG